jgi:AraC-like DNA-binding protein
LHPVVTISCLLGLVLPLIILFFNKGYLSANRYLASFLFFISFYVLEDFVFFYSKSLSRIAFVTNTHAFFYLIGPLAFFYIRSILRDSSKLSKADFLHFALFLICFVGYIPYFFTSWDYKLLIAQNIMSENWDISQFHLNKIFSHKGDQILNVVHSYFYVISLWYLIRHYKKRVYSAIIRTEQYKLIRNWVLIFASIYTVTVINFTVALANKWLYDDKSIFLERANGALIFASVVYIAMNMIVMFFPQIMYGLPTSLPLKATGPELVKLPLDNEILLKDSILLLRDDSTNSIMKSELQLFTMVYLNTIKALLESSSQRQAFLYLDFKLSSLSIEVGVPTHHLTYFFNEIAKTSFSDWRNGLRIDYAMELINQGVANTITLQALSLQCGFASQSTFIRAFRTATGNSSSYYVKSLKNRIV